MGRSVMHWFDSQGIQPNIMGEFDDVALMKAFAREHREVIFLAPSLYTEGMNGDFPIHLIDRIDNLKEEYFVIFAERMIQHPAVKRICSEDFSYLSV